MSYGQRIENGLSVFHGSFKQSADRLVPSRPSVKPHLWSFLGPAKSFPQSVEKVSNNTGIGIFRKIPMKLRRVRGWYGQFL
jgi:hypothetical protein